MRLVKIYGNIINYEIHLILFGRKNRFHTLKYKIQNHYNYLDL